MKVERIKKGVIFEPFEIKLTIETVKDFRELHDVVEQSKGKESLDGLFDLLEEEYTRLNNSHI